MHQKIHNARSKFESDLSFSERVCLKITNMVATLTTTIVFAGIGIGSIIGVATNNTLLGLVFGAVSSYFFQLVLLPVIMIGQRVEGRKGEHLVSQIYEDCEEILTILGRHGIVTRNPETGAEIIMPNYIKEKFDAGKVESFADIV